MKITIAGSGTMGCRFGGGLCSAGHDVLLPDGWREHVDPINASGLRVDDATGSTGGLSRSEPGLQQRARAGAGQSGPDSVWVR